MEKLVGDDDIERSESGAKILRHEPRATGFTPPVAHAVHCEDIQTHVERHVGKVTSVFHEILSDIVHLDVLFIPGDPRRPYNLLVTSGVSDLPMAVPEGNEEFRHAELLIALPLGWKLGGDDVNEESNYWPIRWLKSVGRLPHEHRTWIGMGHTIPNGEPPEPIADTRFIGVMLSAQYPLPDEFFQMKTKSGETVSFYQLVPLYPEEMALKLKKGAAEVQERFEQQRIGFVLDSTRPNVALKRGWFRG